MKYDNIKSLKLSHKEIAKTFNYKTVESFRCSSAHKRIMNGVNNILEMALNKDNTCDNNSKNAK